MLININVPIKNKINKKNYTLIKYCYLSTLEIKLLNHIIDSILEKKSRVLLIISSLIIIYIYFSNNLPISSSLIFRKDTIE